MMSTLLIGSRTAACCNIDAYIPGFKFGCLTAVWSSIWRDALSSSKLGFVDFVMLLSRSFCLIRIYRYIHKYHGIDEPRPLVNEIGWGGFSVAMRSPARWQIPLVVTDSKDLLVFVRRPWFNIKMSSCQYRKSHCGDKTILRLSPQWDFLYR